MTYNQMVSHYGSAAKAAQALGISNQLVHTWKKNGRIPDDWQIRLAGLTGLKPDRKARGKALEFASYINGSQAA